MVAFRLIKGLVNYPCTGEGNLINRGRGVVGLIRLWGGEMFNCSYALIPCALSYAFARYCLANEATSCRMCC